MEFKGAQLNSLSLKKGTSYSPNVYSKHHFRTFSGQMKVLPEQEGGQSFRHRHK